MNYLKLQQIKKLYFNYQDVARIFGISQQSAKVTINRYQKQGLLLRLKRNMYITKDRWINLTREQKFLLANIIQTPSYVSLMTALEYYDISTQMQQNFVESIAIKRTKQVEISETIFNYTKIAKNLYFDFVKSSGFFIAKPEKAFLDAIYLMSFGRYSLDIASLDFSKLDFEKIDSMLQAFPLKTRKYLEDNEHIRTARNI
jgi:predicted transcriptional regulator of viral defense system